jgi:hypothetical protein
MKGDASAKNDIQPIEIVQTYSRSGLIDAN